MQRKYDKRIDYIFHIADIHIRNVRRHTEYRQVFNHLYDEINKRSTDHSVIVVAGDIVHSKIDMSPELIELVSEFLMNLSNLLPTIVILGNHDLNMNNMHRLDALTPIISVLNHENLYYLKDSGVYHFGQCAFNVCCLTDSVDVWTKAKDIDAERKIALYHGPVNKSTTDTGVELESSITTTTFKEHDLVLLGDIHRMQYLDDEKTIAYAGSLIQQNHGETLDGHGMLVWDVDSLTAEFVEIQNDYGYVTLEVANGKILNKPKKLPKRLRLRIKARNTTPSQIKKLLAIYRKKYDIRENKVLLERNDDVIEFQDRIKIRNLNDVEYQNSLLKEYLIEKFHLDDDLVERIQSLNRNVNAQIESMNKIRNVSWIPKRFEFSNMFSYGPDNVIDFSHMLGVYGLFAANASGKSSLLDALSFCIFDKCSRTSKAIDVLNNESDSFSCRLEFELDGRIFVIERTGNKNAKGHVPVEVNFYQILDDEIINLNGDQRDSTNKIIRSYLGEYDDFILTAWSVQNDNTGFIDRSQRERKDLLTQFLDMNIFEELYKTAHNENSETRTAIKTLAKENYDEKINVAQQTRNIILESIAQYETELAECNTQLTALRLEFEQTHNKLVAVNDVPDIDDIERKIKNVNRRILTEQQQIEKITERLEELHVRREKSKNIILPEYPCSTDEYNRISKLVPSLKNDISALKHELKTHHAYTEKLKKHEYDPECKYCVANPIVQQATESLKRITEIDEELTDKNNECISHEKLVQTYNKVDAQISIVRESINQIIEGINTHERNKLQHESTIKALNNELEHLNQLRELYQAQQKAIENNSIVQQEINEIRKRLVQVENEQARVQRTLTELYGDKKVAETQYQNALDGINKLKELEAEHDAWKYYIEAVKRNGIPLYLMDKVLPIIQDEVNSILSEIVDFALIFETDGTNIVCNIQYNDLTPWSINLTSGMEKFISSLAIRIALIKISNLPRPNFIVIDEGFGSLDSENINAIQLFFQYLKSQFEFIMCISHLDTMRDIVDNVISIDKIDNRSKVYFG